MEDVVDIARTLCHLAIESSNLSPGLETLIWIESTSELLKLKLLWMENVIDIAGTLSNLTVHLSDLSPGLETLIWVEASSSELL